ncbi:hypothetical protein [Tardiphaga sp.]|uniref:hypothetical protein n=1 Tax=Tardiphaga sp. TaxID=1926292 RepID=UPI00262CD1D5|nr:hypothetical protein [Tardiphaga sp.]MDB5616105.1 hypothetical protein [Tardiphaga sp.]
MPLNITEKNLDKVPDAYRSLYVEKGGSFHLLLGDLQDHVASNLKPLKDELEIAQASERKLIHNEFSTALRAAGIRPNYEELIIANVGGQINLDTVDGQRIVRVKGADGYPLFGTGPDGIATLADLAKEAAKQFPSVFPNGTNSSSSDAAAVPAKRDGKTLLRSEFDALSGRERAAKMAEGFTVTDDKPASKPRRPLTSTEMTRASFEGLSAVDRAARMKEGFTIVD